MDHSNLLETSEVDLPAWAIEKPKEEPEKKVSKRKKEQRKKEPVQDTYYSPKSNMASMGCVGITSIVILLILWAASFSLFGIKDISNFGNDGSPCRVQLGIYAYQTKCKGSKPRDVEKYKDSWICKSSSSENRKNACNAQQAAFGAAIGLTIAIPTAMAVEYASVKYDSKFMGVFATILTTAILVGWGAVLFGWVTVHLNLKKVDSVNNMEIGAGFYVMMIAFNVSLGLFIGKICCFYKGIGGDSNSAYTKQADVM
eukprot:m.333186 g.333186  ORF g.333186 m.333186 type:complete len:256 (-) comp17089_c0_seq1:144-911(-)